MSDRDEMALRRFSIADLPDDLRTDRPLTGMTLTIGGAVGAFGGFHLYEGRHWVFFHLLDERARRPMLLHRMCSKVLAEAKQCGIDPVYALCSGDVPTAHRWLSRLGFRPLREDEKDDEIRLLESVRQVGDRAYVKGRM